ncbi:hypothetical protein FOL47_005816 [Perkinsus chesapeaki]|uniref:Uncharacterized protein n=1 Tax=Perkinsus chesapeaki TaxID=330153 RepID=A0A7J6LVJ4_PERCH|nr:hypothetical protein FOL47_005816 [Perkinsus chesapeaki]
MLEIKMGVFQIEKMARSCTIHPPNKKDRFYNSFHAARDLSDPYTFLYWPSKTVSPVIWFYDNGKAKISFYIRKTRDERVLEGTAEEVYKKVGKLMPFDLKMMKTLTNIFTKPGDVNCEAVLDTLMEGHRGDPMWVENMMITNEEAIEEMISGWKKRT